MTIRELTSDPDIAGAFPLMAVLRPHLAADSFVAEIRRQQGEGYRLMGGFDQERLVVLAGIRRSHTLSRGDHLFVDDLVTAPDAQRRGYATAMLRSLGSLAASWGVPRLYLDARDTARGFYTAKGFTFLTSIPCWIDVDQLVRL